MTLGLNNPKNRAASISLALYNSGGCVGFLNLARHIRQAQGLSLVQQHAKASVLTYLIAQYLYYSAVAGGEIFPP